LPARSCLIDGEAIACDENGLVVFDLLRRQRRGAPDVTLRAFNLLELDGHDIWRGHSRTVKAPWSHLSAMAILASGTVRAFSRPGKQNDPAFTG
jgi:hypothetical protein